MEKIIETKNCTCWISFNITDVDIDFLERLTPIIGWKKFELPLPNLCPECRKFQRLAWRNEKNIYKRKCDFSGKDIIAIYPPDSIYKVYDETSSVKIYGVFHNSRSLHRISSRLS